METLMETECYLNPQARSRGDVDGTPVVLGDGNEWVLADHVPRLGPVWDRLYDGYAGPGTYEPGHVRIAAWELLRANYNLTADEAADLIVAADPQSLVRAVEVAMLPMPDLSTERTFSRWAESALWSAGLDPDRIPARVRNEVLEHLEAVGRVIPRDRWIGSHRAAAFRSNLTSHARHEDAAAESA